MRAVQQSFYLIVAGCCALLLAAAGSAVADDVNWIGAGVGTTGSSHGDTSTQWNVAANWNPSGVPDPSDSAYLAFTTGGTVYGETSTIGNLYISSSGGGTGAILHILAGNAFTVSNSLRAGEWSVATLRQSGGTVSTGYILVGGSAGYGLAQGLLHLTGGANLRGTLKEYGDNTATIHADDTTLVDLAHTTFVGTDHGTFTAGANSLTILAPGADPNALFGYFHTDGRIHTLGTTLSIATSESLGGCGDLEDFVEAEGTLAARSWGFINLLGGVHVQPGGSVSLAGGTLLTDGVASAIDGGMLTAQHQLIGNAADGSLTQDGGHNTAETRLLLGYTPGATGTYTLHGGSLLAMGWDIVGYSGRGSFTQTGGTHTATNGIDLGFAPGGVGVYDLSGGVLEVSGNCYVGSLGTGQFNQNGGTHTVAENLRLGAVGGARGSYTLQSGHLNVTGTEGVGDFGNGEFVQDGGSHTVGGDLMLGGLAETAWGDFRLHGGELNVLGNEWIGFNGSGWMEQTEGLHTVAGYCVLGASSIGTTAQQGGGVLLLTGGSMTAPYVGVYGDSHFLLGGGTLEIDGGLYFNKASAGTRAVTGAALLLLRDSSIAYLGQAQGGGQTTLQAGAETLVVLPPGADPNTFFSSFSSSGVFATAGTIVPIPEGVTVRGICELDDPVYCAGTMVAQPGQFINLNAGARVGPSGSLNPGDSNLIVNDNWSGMDGGLMELQGSLAIGATAGAHGTFSMTGGSLTVGGNIILAAAANSTGKLRVSRGTSIHADNLILNDWSHPVPSPADVRKTTLTIELASDGNGLIMLGGTAALAGRLEMEAVGGYRPREGDLFTIIDFDPGLHSLTGTFLLPIGTNLPLAIWNFTQLNADGVELVFLGRTYGDANGDHVVDGGDLALMGGNWMKGHTMPFPGDANGDNLVDGGDLSLMGANWMETGKSWGDGDFTGDGLVDGGDLALMGGNWMKPAMTWFQCDFTGDGLVDGGDLALMGGTWWWARPTPASPAGEPIPEPLTVAMIGAAGAALSLRGARRRP